MASKTACMDGNGGLCSGARRPLAAAAALLMAGGAAQCPAATRVFDTAKAFDAGLPTIAVMAVADVNGDGHPDAVSAPARGRQAAVLLGSGDGSLAAPADVTLQVLARSSGGMAAGDLDGDGVTDLAVVGDALDHIDVYKGNGDGSFAAPLALPCECNGTILRIADINGDGRPDIVAVDSDRGIDVLEVYLGRNGGTFQALNRQLIPSMLAADAAVADFNGDGRPDIAVAASDHLVLLTGDGQGAFAPAVIDAYTAAGGGPRLAAADVDGDGNTDLVIAVPQGPASAPATVFLGDGTGGFTAAGKPMETGAPPRALYLVDVNGDGTLDLAAVNGPDSTGNGGGVSVLEGNGDGSFKARRQAAALDSAYGAVTDGAVTDMNGDGIPDIVLAGESDKGTAVAIALGGGTVDLPDGGTNAAGGSELTGAGGGSGGGGACGAELGALSLLAALRRRAPKPRA